MSFCINIPLLSSLGDCDVPKKSQITIDTDLVSKQTTESVMSSISEESTSTIAVQNQNVRIIGSCCDPIMIDQSLNLKVINTSKMDDKFYSDFADKLKNNLINELDSKSNSIKDALGNDSGTNFVGTLKSSIVKVSESSSFQESIKKLIVESFNSQSQDVNIICSKDFPPPKPPKGVGVPDRGCYISQNFLIEQTTNNVMENLFSDVAEDPEFKDMMGMMRAAELDEKPQDSYKVGQVSWVEKNKILLIGVLFILLVPMIIKFLKRLIF